MVINPQHILSLPVFRDGRYDGNIGDYLRALLTLVWTKREGFSGKRPLGDSGWEYDLYKPLVVAGIVSGTVDEDGDVYDIDRDAADQIILEAIMALK